MKPPMFHVSGFFDGRTWSSALGTLVERTTRFTVLVPLKTKDAVTVRHAFARELRTLPAQLRRSLTYDQGPEMREHRLFTQHTKMRVYFAASAVPLGAGHEREHQWSAAAVLSQGHTVYSGITCGDQTGAGDAQRSAPEDLELAQPRTCLSPPVALGS